MLAGPHVAVGSLIGRFSRRAWIALPLAFASHYALDALPHAYLSLRDPRALPLKAAIVVADAIIGFALTFWIARGQAHWRVILGSAFAATMLDLMNPVTSFGRWLAHVPGTAWLISTHIRSAYHVPFGEWLLGFGPSIAVLVLVTIAAWLSMRPPSIPDLESGLGPARAGRRDKSQRDRTRIWADCPIPSQSAWPMLVARSRIRSSGGRERHEAGSGKAERQLV